MAASHRNNRAMRRHCRRGCSLLRSARPPEPPKLVALAVISTGAPTFSSSDLRSDTLDLPGNVRVTQGPMSIEAGAATATRFRSDNSRWPFEKVRAHRTARPTCSRHTASAAFVSGQIAQARVEGSPAQFEQRGGRADRQVRGRAGVIEYDFVAGIVKLTDDVWFSYGKDEFRGDVVIYNVRDERVQVNPGGQSSGRVRGIIRPQGNAHDAPRARGSAAARERRMSQLRVEGLAKQYRSRQVVKDLSLEVSSGEVVGLLGPNGAGKTTAFYMIVGLVPSDAGRIVLDDQDVSNLPVHRRARLGLGYLPQEASVFRKLSVEDNIRAILETRPELNARAARRAAGVAARRAAHRTYSQQHRTKPVRRRAAACGNRACACGRAAVHAAGRAVCGRRPDLRAGYPAHHPAPERPEYRRPDHRS